jgi:formylglycine-generating enzyme required for sulfatase activity
MRRAIALGLGLLVASAARAVEIELVPVGDPGNPADVATSRGDVAEPYSIGRYEVTNAQYAEFLLAVDPELANPYGLWNGSVNNTAIGGITSFYTPKPDFADKPVNGVSWFDAARFVNWLENGQPVGGGGTETGAYDLSGVDAGDSGTWSSIVRSPGALWRLATIDEWYKAAYYDPESAGADGSDTPDYWIYPTRSDDAPTPALCDASGTVTNPGVNVANYDGACEWNAAGTGNVGTVGSAESPSFYGTSDQGGNVSEWIEPDEIGGGFLVGQRGGAHNGAAEPMTSEFGSLIQLDFESTSLGFRVVYVPEPAGAGSATVALFALLARQRSSARETLR